MNAKKLGTLLAVAVFAPGLVFAGDKSQSTMTQPQILAGAPLPVLTGPLSPAWTNGVSGAKTKGDDKCKTQVQLKKLDASLLPNSDQNPGTGDEVICIGLSNISVAVGSGPSSLVLRGEIKNGGVKIKADLLADSVPCKALATQAYDNRMSCYEPDAGFDPVAACAAAGGADLPAPSGDGIVCQGGHVAPPASALIATQGLSIFP